jgi:hypothetical protein
MVEFPARNQKLIFMPGAANASRSSGGCAAWEWHVDIDQRRRIGTTCPRSRAISRRFDFARRAGSVPTAAFARPPHRGFPDARKIEIRVAVRENATLCSALFENRIRRPEFVLPGLKRE